MVKTQTFDFVILGAGIIGLSVAKTLLQQYPNCRICIIEKEPHIGLHSSGRNSGVLHSGIYYPENTLKAKVCAKGAQLMTDFCHQNDLPIKAYGKVIIPLKQDDDPLLETLHTRGKNNGADVHIIDKTELKHIEPQAYTITGRALHSPQTAVINPKAILNCLVERLSQKAVSFHTNAQQYQVDPQNDCITMNGQHIHYTTLYNCTGLYADHIAKRFKLADEYTILPFKGSYFQLSKKSDLHFNGLIYPVPDLNVPFLGIHTVKDMNGSVYFGPSAIPVLGRENYHGIKGVKASEAIEIGTHLSKQYWFNQQGFRQYAHSELKKSLKSQFLKHAQALVPNLQPKHLEPSQKVGIRAQLVNTKTHQLEMDFIVKRLENTVHVLNAVSPAFTSAFEFSRLIVSEEI
ncbi:MAG: L-2-hydroxyglutarate oxidase [Methylococcales bacterium]|jgi:(S)-2-hydroxyglutarate dehydrogenase|nr:L-2-hydroxyglutarate oxidase [Methylococcales bacterium]